MMARWLLITALLLPFLGCVGSGPTQQRGPTVDPQRAAPWTDRAWNDDPGLFHIAVVADRTGGARPGIFAAAVDKLNLLQPEFVIKEWE